MLDLQVYSVAVAQCLTHAHLCLGNGNLGNPPNQWRWQSQPVVLPHLWDLKHFSSEGRHGVSLGLLCCTSQLELTLTEGMVQVPASHWSSLWSAQEMRAGAVVRGRPP